jgi:hypothetical protein
MTGGHYTGGCLDASTRQLLDQEAIDRAYRQDDGHYTRSYAHAVYRGGGLAQECLDNGESLFSGNAGTSFGTLVDRAIPASIAGVPLSDIYAVPPDEVLSNGARRGKPYLEWKANLGSKQDVTAEDYWRIQRILDNCARHPVVVDIFDATQDCQATFRHTDAAGHQRKALADGVTELFLWDFKTTSSSWDQLYRSCMDYGYLWQDAWYSDAALACDWPPHRLKFVFAQTVKPFGVRVYTLPTDLVEQAREQIARTLDQIALRRELGYYRSDEDEEEGELVFPPWTRRNGHGDR